MPTRLSWTEHMRIQPGYATHFAFSPNGTQLAVSAMLESSKAKISIYDLASKYEIQRIAQVSSSELLFSPDGRTLAIQSGAQLFDISNGNKIGTLGNNSIRGMDFFADGTVMALVECAGACILSLWSVPQRERIRYVELETGINGVFISPQGDLIATIEPHPYHTITLWDSRTLEKRYTLQGHTETIQSVAFTPDEGFIISGSSDGTIRLWMPLAERARRNFSVSAVKIFYVNQFRESQGWKASINYASYSPQHQMLAVGAVDGTVQLIDFQTWREIHFLPMEDRVWRVRFSANGLFLAARDDTNTVVVWKNA